MILTNLRLTCNNDVELHITKIDNDEISVSIFSPNAIHGANVVKVGMYLKDLQSFIKNCNSSLERSQSTLKELVNLGFK